MYFAVRGFVTWDALNGILPSYSTKLMLWLIQLSEFIILATRDTCQALQKSQIDTHLQATYKDTMWVFWTNQTLWLSLVIHPLRRLWGSASVHEWRHKFQTDLLGYQVQSQKHPWKSAMNLFTRQTKQSRRHDPKENADTEKRVPPTKGGHW